MIKNDKYNNDKIDSVKNDFQVLFWHSYLCKIQ